MRDHRSTVLLLLVTASLTASPALAGDGGGDVERGRYLVQIGGCNDCHTPGYAESGGKVSEAEWLVGVPVGFRGPWGTSYAANLRLAAQRLDEPQFMARARSVLLPPMPWTSLVAMRDDDLAAIYRFIRSLGPAGEDTPTWIAPSETPSTPYIVFAPQAPELAAN